MGKDAQQEETSITPTKNGHIDIPRMSIKDLKELTQFVNDVKKTLMVEGQDYIKQGDRQYTSRSGYAKLAQGFDLSDEILKEEEMHKEGAFYGYNYTIRVFNKLGRQAIGVGSCSVDEPNLIHHKERPYHDVRSIAFTRAWNRAISNFVGSADVSAEEMSLGPDFERKEIDSSQREVYPSPEKLDTPTWDFADAIAQQGWDAVDGISEAYLFDMGYQNPKEAFEVGHDLAKAWIRNARGVYLGDAFKEVDTVLRIAGFKYNANEKRWRFSKPEGVE